jgi:hypothetical protein
MHDFDNLLTQTRSLLARKNASTAAWQEIESEISALSQHAFAQGQEPALRVFHQILFDLYQLNFVAPHDTRALNQFNPDVLRLRNAMEQQWRSHLQGSIESELQEATIPADGEKFVDWLLTRLEQHPSNGHPLYDYLQSDANLENFEIFFQSEIIVNNMFEEFVALAQLGAPGYIKIELAKNYWDEMGNGVNQKVHTEMFQKLLRHFGLQQVDLDRIAIANPIALAQGNLFLMLSTHRAYFYETMGMLGAGEYLVPKRYQKVVDGARRAGLSDDTLEFYIEHIDIDTDHADEWFRNAIVPTVNEHPEVRTEIARGAYYRMLHIQAFSDVLLRLFTQ